ncbi:3-dehydroquinate synthase [Piscibacillus halophilus]|uniref:3-dehydroquinate synthase n=1 Tax=Piscibacillus halophilus TaxID=571933 RepID=A0A1H8ZUB1_9BACI|nr:3-dehydroquinate synthase [Piscibacillus halophilus]SEP67974.1 3-dehydroquinate synthase [Piscibacillus halophilus]
MKTLTVKASHKTYSILLDKGLRHHLDVILKDQQYSQVVIITDEQVAHHYLEEVLASLYKTSLNVHYYIIKPGEQSKSFTVYEDIQRYLLSQHVDRNSAILALGGGVVGDLAGFVAATYMRGVPFIQMPTTLLAHDSSIGGKVAINLVNTKNIIGSFYPPDMVLYDTETLYTLNKQELRSGFAEMVKHGFIADAKLLEQLKQMMAFSINPIIDGFDELLLRSIRIKQEIVEKDESESGIRKHLNFGHTLGHAIEAIKPYTHGESVMYGILFNLFLSEQINGTENRLLTDSLIDWLRQLDYPLSLISDNDVDVLIEKMLNDKKTINQNIHFILLKEIGKPYIQSMPTPKIKQYLYDFMEKMYKRNG